MLSSVQCLSLLSGLSEMAEFLQELGSSYDLNYGMFFNCLRHCHSLNPYVTLEDDGRTDGM